MRRFGAWIGVLCLGLGLTLACAYPSDKAKQLDTRPLLVVEGAPEGSRLLVDGIDAGHAQAFSGRDAALIVLPGQHLVEVVSNGEVVYSQTVFVSGSATKVIRLDGGKE